MSVSYHSAYQQRRISLTRSLLYTRILIIHYWYYCRLLYYCSARSCFLLCDGRGPRKSIRLVLVQVRRLSIFLFSATRNRLSNTLACLACAKLPSEWTLTEGSEQGTNRALHTGTVERAAASSSAPLKLAMMPNNQGSRLLCVCGICRWRPGSAAFSVYHRQQLL